MVMPRNLNDSTPVTVLFMMVIGGRVGGFSPQSPYTRAPMPFWHIVNIVCSFVYQIKYCVMKGGGGGGCCLGSFHWSQMQ